MTLFILFALFINLVFLIVSVTVIKEWMDQFRRRMHKEMATQIELGQTRDGKVEHLYHLVLALARLNLINPTTLKTKLSERKENYELAVKLFSDTK